MFWWFERNGAFLRFETRNVPDGFELRIIQADGSDRVERFADSTQLAKRQTDLEATLAADGWTGPHTWLL